VQVVELVVDDVVSGAVKVISLCLVVALAFEPNVDEIAISRRWNWKVESVPIVANGATVTALEPDAVGALALTL